MARPLGLLLCLLIAMVPRPTSAGMQAPATDEQAAADATVELSSYEAAGDFNALYDRIHPDAHAIIPRAAAIGWFEEAFAPRGPGVSTVTGVRFVEWTWPVTGQTYPYTAEVSYRQPFADGTAEEGIVRLVQDRNGEWRWFFGRNLAFVEEQIAKYVTVAPLQVVTGSESVVNVVTADLDDFWKDVFSAESVRYGSPTVVPFGQPVDTACGAVDASIGPAYCPLDRTIYLEQGFLIGAEFEIGDFAAAFVVAHEWGHHVQHLRGFERSEAPDEFGELYSIELELMADCYAGVWTRDADTRGILDPGDVEEAILLALQLGDLPGTSPHDPTAHGTNPQRVKAFLDGYFDGIMACEALDGGSTPPEGSSATEVPHATRVVVDEDLRDLLPNEGDVPAALVVTLELRRALPEVAANYGDPAETEQRFADWGWMDNVVREFGPADGVRLPPDATDSLYVSVHRFGDGSAAAEALDYSIANQAAATEAQAIRVGRIGDRSRALVERGEAGNAATVYAQRGTVLVRVTAVSPEGDPMADAQAVAKAVIIRAG
ncbi:MAG: neutral zinc metallopeptidase [Chloroflexota bacterium]|nr:neutral zinc metallopeptidase [Chloroflexota bacterium]